MIKKWCKMVKLRTIFYLFSEKIHIFLIDIALHVGYNQGATKKVLLCLALIVYSYVTHSDPTVNLNDMTL